MGCQITDDLPGIPKFSVFRGDEGSIGRTWSAVIPFASAFFTLSRVIAPTTRFGNRDFKVTNKFNTAVCNGLSGSPLSTRGIGEVNTNTCVSIQPVVRL